jgi:tetratricopeptide (TPR) repeat protein
LVEKQVFALSLTRRVFPGWLLLAGAVAWAAPPAPAPAGGGATGSLSPAPDDGASAEQARQQALRLFEEGQARYALGEYDEAIARFRQAYQLSSAPGLLYNIAQAHRLKGDCRQALEVYRHFVRLYPDAPNREDADGQISVLETRCPAEPAPPSGPAPPVPPAPGTSEPEAQVRTSPPVAGDTAASPRRSRLALGLLAAGVVVGAAAGGIHLWNDARHDRWAGEDRRLEPGPPAGVPPADWIRRQDDNDALLRSIQSVDKVVIGLAGASLACVVGAAAAGILWSGAPTVQAGPRAVQVGWRASF